MVQYKLKKKLDDHPFWRTEENQNDTLTISEMITEILCFKNIWDEFKLTEEYNNKLELIKKQLKNIRIDFFVSVQIEEGIGLSTQEIQDNKNKIKENTETILNELETNFKNFNTSPEYKHSKSVEGVLQVHEKCTKNKIAPQKSMEKSMDELVNLYRAFSDLNQDSNEDSQMLALDTLTKSHAILMNGLLDGKTAPGQFSTCTRQGLFGDKIFKYPTFDTPDVTADVLSALIDDYNSSVFRAKKRISNQLTGVELQNIFQSAAKFLFIFLQLHPFSDGNGRLGRLICSYFLELVCPFPSSIYNVYSDTEKSDYVKVLVKARKGISFNRTLATRQEGLELYGELLEHDESELASLIIESNYCSWKKFFSDVGNKIPEFAEFKGKFKC